ncbi:transposase [Rhodococcus globerulus]|uniref:transposase n=1 Tax=Rhodococcus globerulus TaxID=33008 RepID=UPI00374E3220
MSANDSITTITITTCVNNVYRYIAELSRCTKKTEHLGHDKNQVRLDRQSTNVRNGTRPKTVLTGASGHVPIEVPRNRQGTFEPQIALEAPTTPQRCR